jgi:hypothetical protein
MRRTAIIRPGAGRDTDLDPADTLGSVCREETPIAHDHPSVSHPPHAHHPAATSAPTGRPAAPGMMRTHASDHAVRLLTLLAERAAATVASRPDAIAFLRSAGITDPAVWDAWRIGAGDDGMLDGLDAADRARLDDLGVVYRQRNQLAGPGISLPTCDPRTPERIIGVVRLTPGQNKHRFATNPLGLAVPLGFGNPARVILADAPLLALRLFQAGARHVALAEDPAVLAPLGDWFAGREVVIASYKRSCAERLRAGLGPLAGRAEIAQVQPEIRNSEAGVLAALGLDRAAFGTDDEVPPITPHLLQDLLTYAQGRLASAAAGEALRHLGADHPEFAAAYRLGFLPADFRRAMAPEHRRALEGLRMANAVLVPAFDDTGAIVDVLAVQAADKGHANVGAYDAPRGLLAPTLATACDALIVTDSFRWAARLTREGHRNVLLLRGVVDAAQNAERLHRSGVRQIEVRARRERDEIASALRRAGLAVTVTGSHERDASVVPFPPQLVPATTTAPAPSASAMSAAAPVSAGAGIALREHNPTTEMATFRAGDLTYVVEVPWDATSRLEVSVASGETRHRDRFDLAVEAQRRRFATSVTMRLGVPSEVVETHCVALLDAVRLLARPIPASGSTPAAPVIPAAERDAAMALLTAPDLLEQVGSDLDGLGWAGEDEAKRLLYLAAISRKLPEPLWAARLASPGAGKSHGLDLIAALTPPEDLLQVSRLTDTALFHADPDALRNRLLIVDEADALTPEVVVALRVLHTRGALSMSQVQRDGVRGETRTRFMEVQGPVSVLTTTAGTLDDQLQSRLVEVPVDESPAQTARVLAAQRRAMADPAARLTDGMRAQIIARHRSMQRLLAARPVVIPFAERIEFPASSVRFRREQERFLGLIAASALLHQHQRLSDGACIVADTRDFAVAVRLVGGRLGQPDQGLGRQAQALLQALWQAGATTFTMDDCAALCPQWTRYAFRAALGELMALDYIASPRGGRGTLREYRLVAAGTSATAERANRIHLRPSDEPAPVGGLVEVGDTGIANSTVVAGAG